MKQPGFWMSLQHACRGLKAAVVGEKNIRIHLMAALLAMSTGVVMRLNTWEWALLVGTIAAVLTTELLNTALEQIVDLISPGYHPQAGLIKDVAAGAVLVMSLGAAILGSLILLSAAGRW
ncbi:MAG: diacylglycerol kinase [Planctomycetaceae bacterium]|nr:MAG: diacylglycerol kinase [Planctomycetaceae bacterium]